MPTRAALLDALRAGRSWIAASVDVEVEFAVVAGGRTAGVGERLVVGREPAAVRLAVSGVPGGTVTLHTARGPVHRETLPGAGAGTVVRRGVTGAELLVRAEVRDPAGRMAALTNPVVLA